MDFKEAVKYILDIPRFGSNVDGRGKTGNENLAYIMDKLGNPHMSCKAIHVAGTNGKGSTVQFIKNILEAAGYRVGCFTSPHIVNINERICMSEPISDEAFLECFEIVKKAVDSSICEGHEHLSFFEFMFAMAAVYFDKELPDYVVYETGLGGRLDATNILKPVITVITAIGLDHTKYLGDTIREIAFEKAGIIKQGVPVVFNTGDIEADAVVNARADLLDAEAINVAKTEYIINDFTDKSIDFSLHNRYYKYDNIILPVGSAVYQVDNAMTAITVCNTLFGEGNYANEELLQSGLDRFFWQGRMEQIHDNIILDGAHNPNAIERFVECVKLGHGNSGIRLLFAVSDDKDYEPMIDTLCSELKLIEVYVTSLDSDRGISADYIAGLFKMYLAKSSEHGEYKVMSDDDIRQIFLQGAESAIAADDMLYCVGSLYLIGSIKEIAAEVFKHD